MNLKKLPRVHLAHLPTPLEPLPRLTKALNGPEICIKRDDCTGLSAGGNKTRKLECLMAEALAQKADIILTPGATQSNTPGKPRRQRRDGGLIAACGWNKQGAAFDPQSYRTNGNMLLNRLHGATIKHYSPGSDMSAEMAGLANELRAQGRNPYAFPIGGSPATGALGYVNCALELLNQCVEYGSRC